MTKKIAIQGERASFHDVAARQFFGDDITIVPCDLPFSKVFDAFESADFAVCAIENSIHGVINEVYDLLLERRPWICGEVVLPIEQCLIGLPGAQLAAIREVYSHPVALSQCKQFLSTTLPQAKLLEADDTAGSVGLIAKWNDPTKAAIASAAAAKLYGMAVLAKAIETNHHNYTRFVVLAHKRPIEVKEANKTSLVLQLPHTAGSLAKALATFADQGINLSLIVSRPVVGKPGQYLFYIDLEVGLNNETLQIALANLHTEGNTIEILGSYRKNV
jgi:prephenate dehydratase